jgi:serine/threonine protein kinase
MALNAGNRLGPYTIKSPLGKGGMGEVYLAVDTRLERDVAIKVLPDNLSSDPNALKRFQGEAKVLASLSHRNIVSIFDVGSEDGNAFVVMELLSGETLRSRLSKGVPSWQKAVEIAVVVAEGLAAAHSNHIGLLDWSKDEVQKGLELSEQNKVEAFRTEGIIALITGRYDEAVRKLEEVQRISDKPISDTYLGLAYFYNGDKQKAIDTMKALAKSSSASASSRAQAALASFYAASKRKNEAQELVTSVITKKYLDHHVAYSLGVAYANLGQTDEALD